MIVQTFYNGVTPLGRSTIDVEAGGTLMNKTEDEAYNLIDELTLSNYMWSNERSQPKRVSSKLELYAISMLSTKVGATFQRLEWLNVNSISSSMPSLTCEICGSADHLAMNCQVESPFTQDVSDRVNHVNTYKPGLANDPFSNAHNFSWRNHPNFSYRSNAPHIP